MLESGGNRELPKTAKKFTCSNCTVARLYNSHCQVLLKLKLGHNWVCATSTNRWLSACWPQPLHTPKSRVDLVRFHISWELGGVGRRQHGHSEAAHIGSFTMLLRNLWLSSRDVNLYLQLMSCKRYSSTSMTGCHSVERYYYIICTDMHLTPWLLCFSFWRG